MLNFKNIRIEKKLNQKEFADKIGISTRALSSYENGNLDITLKKMQEIACILDIGFFDLFTVKPNSLLIIQEPSEEYKVTTIEQAQQKTIKVLESQLAFANSLLASNFKSQEH